MISVLLELASVIYNILSQRRNPAVVKFWNHTECEIGFLKFHKQGTFFSYFFNSTRNYYHGDCHKKMWKPTKKTGKTKKTQNWYSPMICILCNYLLPQVTLLLHNFNAELSVDEGKGQWTMCKIWTHDKLLTQHLRLAHKTRFLKN